MSSSRRTPGRRPLQWLGVAVPLAVVALLVVRTVSDVVRTDTPPAIPVLVWGSMAVLLVLLVYPLLGPAYGWIPDALATLSSGSVALILFVLPILLERGQRLDAASELTVALPVFALDYVLAARYARRIVTSKAEADLALLLERLDGIDARLAAAPRVERLPAAPGSKLRRVLKILLED